MTKIAMPDMFIYGNKQQNLLGYAIHIYEEAVMDWKRWVESISQFKHISWFDFCVANAALAVAGVCTAMVGWKEPSFALILPALQIINGLCFHLLPTILYRRYSPGVLTSIVLFFPIGIWAYWGAWTDRVLTTSSFIWSFVFASLVMALPFFFLKLREKLEQNS